MKWNTDKMRDLISNGLPQYQVRVDTDSVYSVYSVNTDFITVFIPDSNVAVNVYAHRAGSGKSEDGGYDGSYNGTKDNCEIKRLLVSRNKNNKSNDSAGLRLKADVLEFLSSQKLI